MEFRAEEASPQLVNKKFLVYTFVSDPKLFRIAFVSCRIWGFIEKATCIEGSLDEKDSVEEPMLYDYDKLVDLFNAFNSGKEGALSPTSTLFRAPSRGSNRSSVSMSYANDWAKKG